MLWKTNTKITRISNATRWTKILRKMRIRISMANPMTKSWNAKNWRILPKMGNSRIISPMILITNPKAPKYGAFFFESIYLFIVPHSKLVIIERKVKRRIY